MSATEQVTLGSFCPGYFANMIYTAPTGPSRAAINMFCNSDIAMHCNPRYDERAIVLNSLVNGAWQHEERPHNFPFYPGSQTQVTAIACDQTIDILANGTQFCHPYRHRYDVTRVNKIDYNSGGAPVQAFIGRALPDYGVGKVIYIKGQTAPGKKFNISLVPSLPHNYQPQNASLSMGFRFNESVVVRNSKANDKWGQEERAGGFPIVGGQEFSVTIVAQSQGYEIGINGEHFTHFRHRAPLSKEMSVQIIGVPYIKKIDYC